MKCSDSFSVGANNQYRRIWSHKDQQTSASTLHCPLSHSGEHLQSAHSYREGFPTQSRAEEERSICNPDLSLHLEPRSRRGQSLGLHLLQPAAITPRRHKPRLSEGGRHAGHTAFSPRTSAGFGGAGGGRGITPAQHHFKIHRASPFADSDGYFA